MAKVLALAWRYIGSGIMQGTGARVMSGRDALFRTAVGMGVSVGMRLHRQSHFHLSSVRRMALALHYAIPLAAVVTTVPSAWADDAWHFQVGATTDRIKRGIDESQGEPSVDVSASWYPGTGPFAGVSGWTVRPFYGTPRGGEFVADAGYGWRAGDWSAQAIVLHYQFAHTPAAKQLEYDEAALKAGWREVLFASVTASPNTSYGGSARTLALAYNLVGHYPLAHGFSATAGIGYYDLHAGIGNGFFYDDIGLNYQYRSLQFQVAYFGTQAPAPTERRFGSMLVHRWVAQVSWSF